MEIIIIIAIGRIEAHCELLGGRRWRIFTRNHFAIFERTTLHSCMDYCKEFATSSQSREELTERAHSCRCRSSSSGPLDVEAVMVGYLFKEFNMCHRITTSRAHTEVLHVPKKDSIMGNGSMPNPSTSSLRLIPTLIHTH